MKVLDSSVWIEFLQGTKLSNKYRKAIDQPDELKVPAISLYEVYRFVLREDSEQLAIQAVGLMMRSPVIELDAAISIRAAVIGDTHKIPMADSVIYATAESEGAELWTQDIDLKPLPNVRYFAKPPTP